MAYLEDIEYKAVKRNKLGPIDVYPQEERQKEVNLRKLTIFSFETIKFNEICLTGRTEHGICKKWF